MKIIKLFMMVIILLILLLFFLLILNYLIKIKVMNTKIKYHKIVNLMRKNYVLKKLIMIFHKSSQIKNLSMFIL